MVDIQVISAFCRCMILLPAAALRGTCCEMSGPRTAEVEARAATEVLAGLPGLGLDEVVERLKSHTWLDEPRLVTRSLARIASRGAGTTALHVLTYMESQQIKANAFHYAAVISGCARSGSWKIALSLLQKMVHRDIQRDSVTFNSAINACGKGAQWETSLFLVTTMVETNLNVGSDTVNSVMCACTRAAQWERALDIFGDAEDPDLITFSSALAACDKGSQWRASLQFLASASTARDVKLDNYGYSAAISACATAERWEFACSIVEMMGANAVRMDMVTYGSVLKALGAGKEWAMAMWLLHQLEKQELSQVMWNSAISVCASGSQWQHACVLLQSMSEFQAPPEDVSYNTAINACVRGSSWEQGLILFNEMPEAVIKPDQISFNSVLSACQRGSHWQLSLSLLEEMSSCHLPADEFCFTTALSACEIGGWQLCLRVLDGLEGRHMDITPIMFGVLMSACEGDGAWEAALATLDAITCHGLIPDALHAGSAANALRKGCGEEAALELLGKMKRLWSGTWHTYQQQDFPKDHATVRSWMQAGMVGKIVQHGQGVVACYKPAGIATEVFVDELAVEVFPEAHENPFSIVSRLDHPTSGILMVALGVQGSPAANWLQVQFASRLVDKKYICLCEGLPLGSIGSTGSVSAPLCADEVRGCMVVPEAGQLGRESLTNYRILARYMPPVASAQELMLLEVKPITGRTHQIRVHMAHLGRPLVGDLTYGAKELSILCCERLFLHCRRVRLRDFSDQQFCAVASLPAALRQVLAKLEPLPPSGQLSKIDCKRFMDRKFTMG